MSPLSESGRGPDFRADAVQLQSEALLALARTCEAAGFGQQAGCIVNAGTLIAPSFRELFTDPLNDMLARAQGYAMAGAYESAVLAMMPNAATFTGGRLPDGTVIAQVVIGPEAAAHSRDARWLAMAWLAALLRAVAMQIDLNSQTTGTGL